MLSLKEIHRSKKFGTPHVQGIVMVILASTFWGLSGTAAQVLFQRYGISPSWLVDVRLTLSGTLLLVIQLLRGNGRKVFFVWHGLKDAFAIILFGLFGMLGVQYTYFVTIQYGNAATATLLQYLGPVVIIIYTAFRYLKIPSKKEILAAGLAVIGTYLLVTNGSLYTIIIPFLALVWGLGSAIALAFYTIFPKQLLLKFGSVSTAGWGMLIGGFVFSIFSKPWVATSSVPISFTVILLVLFVVVFGTFLAFYLYIDSLRSISPTEASLLSCAEPLSASFVSIIWFHIHLGFFSWLGAACILGTIIVLALGNPMKKTRGILK